MFTSAKAANAADVLIHAVEACMICYVGGRLVKAKQNQILMAVIAALRIATIISAGVAGVSIIGATTPLIVWFDICVAYFLRYKAHREAGLEDATK